MTSPRMALSTRCTVISAFVVATALVVVARAGASIPFGPDDSGFLISDSAKSKCEQKVAGNVAKLAKGLLKCHSKMADASFTTMTPVDDESCESTAISAFLAKTDVTACPCVDPSNIASLWEGSLDTQNSALYCDTSGTVFGGDDAGYVPTNADELKCEDKLVKCKAKLVKNYWKCHQNAAKSYVKGVPFDEDACEQGPISGKPGKAALEQYNTCVSKVVAAGGCNGCENPNLAAAGVAILVENNNNLVFCEQDPGTCPTSFAFTATGSNADVDAGWTGLSHDEDMATNSTFTLSVGSCPNTSPPCGQCTTSGPIANAGTSNRRCRGDNTGANGSWITCTSDADCSGTGNACVYYFGPPRPVADGGFTVCITNEIASATGTLDPDAGSSVTALTSSWTTYTGPTVAHPCPICVSNVCSGGQRNGMACTTTGTSAEFLSDPVSFDCPPSVGVAIGRQTAEVQLSTGTQTLTLSATNPNCRASGYTSSKCFCDTCNNAAATPCLTDADCTAVGATTCGGKRCLGSPNAGTPCSNSSECPSGSCNSPGQATQPNSCSNGVCSPSAMPLCLGGPNAAAPCSSASECPGGSCSAPDLDSTNEGVCASGPADQFCHIETFRSCSTNANCTHAGDSCGLVKFRECFTTNGTLGDQVSAGGVASATNPTLAGLFCRGPGVAGAENTTFGYPGLVRMTIPGTATTN